VKATIGASLVVILLIAIVVLVALILTAIRLTTPGDRQILEPPKAPPVGVHRKL
jgi:hypothetical protein